MKKLTAGIFATLLTVVTVGAANANIASQGYVDDIKTALEADIDAKADSATTLAGYGITDAYTKTEVDNAVNLKENSANKADTTTATTESNKTSETLFPTVAATYKIAADAVAGVTTDVEGKVDIAQGAEDANKAVITDASGNVTVGQVASGMIADGAVTEAKIGTGAVTTTKLAADAVTNEKLADNAVQTANIANGAVTEAKLDTALVTKMNSLIANPGECANPANKCVLTYSGTDFAWEVIARGTSEDEAQP